MARAKSNNIASNDGRKNNSAKKGVKRGATKSKMIKATTTSLNKAKKDRLPIYIDNSIIEEWGTKQDFWFWVAKQAHNGSNVHLKYLIEYGEGKAIERSPSGAKDTKKAPTINFNVTGSVETTPTIDITHDEESDNS